MNRRYTADNTTADIDAAAALAERAMQVHEWTLLANAARMTAYDPNMDRATREQLLAVAQKCEVRRAALEQGRVLP